MQLEGGKDLLTEGEMSMTRMLGETMEFSETQKCTEKRKAGQVSFERTNPAAFVAVTRAAAFLTANQH